jgi:ribosomal protein L11 methyltransferase
VHATIETTIACSQETSEILSAQLLDYGFVAFEETPGALKAYIDKNRWSETTLTRIKTLARGLGLSGEIAVREIRERNWNEQWESSLKPLSIGRFFVKPGWLDTPEEAVGRILLEIEPKMSFGTGYHETTRLMLRLLPDVVAPDTTVLDAGTGTGILAISAVKLGAKRVFAFDTDAWSGANAAENVERNGVAERVSVRVGDIDVVPVEPYDAILANINLRVLINLIPRFRELLAPDGSLVLSGVLSGDVERLYKEAKQHGFSVSNELQEGDWVAAIFQISNS